MLTCYLSLKEHLIKGEYSKVLLLTLTEQLFVIKVIVLGKVIIRPLSCPYLRLC